MVVYVFGSYKLSSNSSWFYLTCIYFYIILLMTVTVYALVFVATCMLVHELLEMWTLLNVCMVWKVYIKIYN